MKTELFYFSGTGNSLFLAKELAVRLGGESTGVKLTSIAGLARDKSCETNAERVGLIFPVYFLDIPDIVKSFIARLRAPNADYLFGVSNCGSLDGGVTDCTVRLASKNGLSMTAFFRFFLPDNSIVFPTDPGLHSGMFDAAQEKLDHVADLVQSSTSILERSGAPAGIVPGKFMKAVCFGLYGFKDFRCDRNSCTGCGLCEQVCPIANVTLKNGQPEWGSQSACTSCFACLHYCPAGAIKFRRQKKNGEYQYRNPYIKVAEMVAR